MEGHGLVWCRYRTGRVVHLILPGDALPACGARWAPTPHDWIAASAPTRWRRSCLVCFDVWTADRRLGSALADRRNLLAELACEHLVAHQPPLLPVCVRAAVDRWAEATAELAAHEIERGALL